MSVTLENYHGIDIDPSPTGDGGQALFNALKILAARTDHAFLQNVVEDATPQLGGDLDLDGHLLAGASAAEIGHLVGVSAALQTQLDGKAPLPNIGHFAAAGDADHVTAFLLATTNDQENVDMTIGNDGNTHFAVENGCHYLCEIRLSATYAPGGYYEAIIRFFLWRDPSNSNALTYQVIENVSTGADQNWSGGGLELLNDSDVFKVRAHGMSNTTVRWLAKLDALKIALP